MRVFVISDTHGKLERILNKIETMEKPDLIIHLGDYVDDGLKIEKILGIETIIVKGNGDYFQKDYNEDELIEVNGKKIFLTHGHNYHVSRHIDSLIYRGEELKTDIILYGHTHVPLITEEKGRFIMNPGSPTFPRGYERGRTFGIIEIGRDISGMLVDIN